MTDVPPSASHTQPRSRFRRGWRILAACIVLAVGVLGAAGWWAGHPGSLAQALALASRFLPAEQTLQSRDVDGSLLRGGRIGWLRWSSPSLAVEVHEAHLEWRLPPLLDKQLQWQRIDAARIEITPRTATAAEAQPPAHLELPVRIDAPFHVSRLIWAGAPRVEIEHLKGNYQFDGHAHQLALRDVRWAKGRYSLDATVAAQAPMALQAMLQGRLPVQVPGGRAESVQAEAAISVSGTLAGLQAELTAQADVRTLASAMPAAQAPYAHAQIVLHPWQRQAVQQAAVRLQAIDLAAFWPQAPATSLHGSLQAGPDTPQDVWAIQAELRNDRPGPWDLSRLPVARLHAQVRWDGTHWRIPEARATLGVAPRAGEVLLQGQYTPGSGALQGRIGLNQLPPEALHQALGASPALSGLIEARTLDLAAAQERVSFDADIRAAPGAAKALAVRSIEARGQWQRAAQGLGRVDLAHVQIDAFELRAEANELRLQLGADPSATEVQGQVAFSAPGSTARFQGRVAADNGQGDMQWTIADARQVQRWLAGLPRADQWLPGALRTATLQGQGQLDVQWRGGWLSVAPRVGRAQPGPSQALSLQARLTVPQAQWYPSSTGLDAGRTGMPPPPINLQGVAVQLAGNAQQAHLTLAGSAATAEHQLTLEAAAEGAWIAPRQWPLQLQNLRARYVDLRKPGQWEAALAAPVALQLSAPATPAGAPLELTAGAGQLRVTGPLPGGPVLSWAPLRYLQAPNTPPRLYSRGELQGLPLAWVDALPTASGETNAGPPLLQRMGLGTDMVLAGEWTIAAADTLSAHAQLRRASGDIRLQDRTGPARAPTTAAGVREAMLDLAVDQEDVQARLVWRSERAGDVDAQVRTRWQRITGAWPADAPLAGVVRARLPDVGVWSALAPPGWRVRGTFDAQAQLSGTRNAPRWAGTLAADDLALRSVIDGVDLRDGRLRATLAGNELRIDELRLQGGQGSKARILGQSGNRTPAPDHGGELVATGRLSWADAPASGGTSSLGLAVQVKAQALQALVRADRQVSVSGQLQATLSGDQLVLRGGLTIDRATIVLPDESRPSLGADVVVVSAAQKRAAAQAAAEPRGTPVHPPDLAITLDLGKDFALQGHGITTRLTGSLDLRSNGTAGAVPSVTGEIQTEQGRYRAWGQSLDVESGSIRFRGPYDNPALDILALRPNIAVRAGVQVGGSALAPRVQLYSEPQLPDAEILAWVVLGRSAAAGGAEAAMLQQAALALLGNKGQNTSARLAQSLGVDEIGMRSAAAGEDASATALTLGKRLSRDLYISYERSLSSAMGVLYIFYDLSRNLTLRGQTGATSAVDVVYTLRYD